MNKQLVIAYPDQVGKLLIVKNRPFVKELQNSCNIFRTLGWEVNIIPLLNGLDLAELKRQLPLYPPDFSPILVNKSGVAATLLEGYGQIISKHSSGFLIRLDTAEHPVVCFTRFLELLKMRFDMVVGDLVYPVDLLGKHDLIYQQDRYPKLFSTLSNSLLNISGAHGYQAFRLETLPEIWRGAVSIFEQAGRKFKDGLKWGFDGAMIWSAFLQKMQVGIVKIPGIEFRNRSKQKNEDQYQAFDSVGKAAIKVFNLSDISRPCEIMQL